MKYYLKSQTEVQDQVSVRITGFLNFVLSPEFYILENTTFPKQDLFPFSGNGRETPTLLGSLERANLNHWKTHVQAEVILRQTVSRPVGLGVGPPSGPWPDFKFR
jgi:hypothetical protein